jgi:hypothetical protein
VAGAHVVEEDPAVVDHPGDDRDVVGRAGVQRELAGPRLERVEDEHRPVHAVAEALQRGDDVEREAVGRPGRDADAVGEALVAERGHRVPHGLGRVARAVRVVQQQQVEAVGAAALQRALRGPAQVARVVLGAAQARVGEPREALRALALAVVEVVADAPTSVKASRGSPAVARPTTRSASPAP